MDLYPSYVQSVPDARFMFIRLFRMYSIPCTSSSRIDSECTQIVLIQYSTYP